MNRLLNTGSKLTVLRVPWGRGELFSPSECSFVSIPSPFFLTNQPDRCGICRNTVVKSIAIVYSQPTEDEAAQLLHRSTSAPETSESDAQTTTPRVSKLSRCVASFNPSFALDGLGDARQLYPSTGALRRVRDAR